MKKLFEYGVIYNPKPVKDNAGNDITPDALVLIKPEYILAKSEQEVTILAARKIPDNYLDKLEEVEILVRPF